MNNEGDVDCDDDDDDSKNDSDDDDDIDEDDDDGGDDDDGDDDDDVDEGVIKVTQNVNRAKEEIGEWLRVAVKTA